MNRNRQQQRRQTHEQKQPNTDRIRDMELEALSLSNERNDYAEQALKIKTESMMEVEAEWETFKSKGLSNQTKRNAAADDRLALDETYSVLVNDIRIVDAAIKELAINISFEKRQFTRSTNHIEDLHDIKSYLDMLSKDIHVVTLHILTR